MIINSGGNVKKKDYILIGLLFSIIVIILIIFLVSSVSKNKYDISKMETISVIQALKLFDNSETSILFFGRESCAVCEKLVPVLNQAQKENNFVTKYLDITKINRSGDSWKELVSKLDLVTSATLSEDVDDDAEVVTETYGYFLDNFGFTPTVIMIKDGKQISGFIGNKTLEEFNTWYTYYNN